MMGSWFGTGMGWGWVLWLLLIAGTVVVVVVRAIGRGVHRGGSPARPDGASPVGGRAREVLDERYARGELATEEYRERLSALREG